MSKSGNCKRNKQKVSICSSVYILETVLICVSLFLFDEKCKTVKKTVSLSASRFRAILLICKPCAIFLPPHKNKKGVGSFFLRLGTVIKLQSTIFNFFLLVNMYNTNKSTAANLVNSIEIN